MRYLLIMIRRLITKCASSHGIFRVFVCFFSYTKNYTGLNTCSYICLEINTACGCRFCTHSAAVFKKRLLYIFSRFSYITAFSALLPAVDYQSVHGAGRVCVHSKNMAGNFISILLLFIHLGVISAHSFQKRAEPIQDPLVLNKGVSQTIKTSSGSVRGIRKTVLGSTIDVYFGVGYVMYSRPIHSKTDLEIFFSDIDN